MEEFNLFALENKIQAIENEIAEMKDLEMPGDVIEKREMYLTGLHDAMAVLSGHNLDNEELPE